MLLEINGKDYTNYVQESTYKVGATDIYQEWTDANTIKHRIPIRERVAGSFDMVFVTDAEADAFIAELAPCTQTMKVYVQNRNEVRECSFNCDVKAKKYAVINSTHTYNRVSVAVEEA